jgi:hypothetical protein
MATVTFSRDIKRSSLEFDKLWKMDPLDNELPELFLNIFSVLRSILGICFREPNSKRLFNEYNICLLVPSNLPQSSFLILSILNIEWSLFEK